ncbi:MAG: PEP-utilizing enzyme [Gordonia sp. (in: high G+C Gram-positive bacteria)]
MSNSPRHAGTGINLFATEDLSGTARWFEDTSDVLDIDEDDLPDTIAFVHKGGMAFLSPILPDLRAIVCTAGSRESHLAILSRESAVPCVLAADIFTDLPDGARVTLGLRDAQRATIDIVTAPAATA